MKVLDGEHDHAWRSDATRAWKVMEHSARAASEAMRRAAVWLVDEAALRGVRGDQRALSNDEREQEEGEMVKLKRRKSVKGCNGILCR